ncbi:hypothetical protein E3P89_01411 [Wallemia ichthyophaga]|uniref:DNA repair protein RAD5 n=1 Tax=Wallemia ichthyophaga TaxID=245174 RepID=A0A4T0I3D3_WALIC|nr:hypothetical protein E3P90_01811 [Wallemia ichthyophaga]TIB14729.1 hypothetical protein E3P93_01561 [Wallemia ichthyophaga]TIB23656.1 hypothetical protein E3P89_01411 [Wallemia ichthyophaga]TIB25103.1 hypothetical protein E3P88_01766 [Wallemia ichthyophaga]
MTLIDFPKCECEGEIEKATHTQATSRKFPLSLPFDLRMFAVTWRPRPATAPTYTATVNEKRIALGVELLEKAIEADRRRDDELCYEAYFHAVDLIFSAINERKEMDSRRMEHLESMINCHLLKLGLTPVSCTKDRRGGWREGVIETSTAIAVAAKKSKLHQYALGGLINIVNALRQLNERFQISWRLVNALERAVALFVRLDSHLGLHQSACEIGWTAWEATVKAAIAYAQAALEMNKPRESKVVDIDSSDDDAAGDDSNKRKDGVIDLTNDDDDVVVIKSTPKPQPPQQPISFDPLSPSAPVCIGEITCTALVMIPSNYIQTTPEVWKDVRLAYVPQLNHSTQNPPIETIRVYPPAHVLGQTPALSLGAGQMRIQDSFAVVDRRTAGVLGPLMLQRCVRIEGVVKTKSGSPMMLPMKLLLFTRRDLMEKIAHVVLHAGIAIEEPERYRPDKHCNAWYESPAIVKTFSKHGFPSTNIPSYGPLTNDSSSSLNPYSYRPQYTGHAKTTEVNRSQQANEMLGKISVDELPETLASSRIATTLYPHQKQALTFLLECERDPRRSTNESDKFSFWKQSKDKRKFQHIITHNYLNQEPAGCRGAILADDMGLGKTISVVALIASTFESANDYALAGPSKSDTEKKPKRQEMKAPDASHFSSKFAIPGMPQSNSGITDSFRKENDDQLEGASEKSRRLRKERLQIRSKATVIVSPLSTLSNWEEQFSDHMTTKPHFYRHEERPPRKRKDDGLNIYIYHGNNRKKEVSFLMQFDVILTAFSTVATEFSKQDTAIKKLHLAQEKWDEMLENGTAFANTNGVSDDDVSFVSDSASASGASSSKPTKLPPSSSSSSTSKPKGKGKRKKKGEDDLEGLCPEMLAELEQNAINYTSPLQQIEWFRIVLDEAHYIKDPSTMMSKAASELAAERRLCLTGTPIQNKIEDLYALLRFLHLEPFDERETWNTYIGTPIKQQLNVGFARIQIIMKHITMRRTKEMKNKDGTPIVSLPDRSDELRSLEFNPRERAIYENQHGKSKDKYLDLRDADDAVNAFAESPLAQAQAIFQVMRDSETANCLECYYDFVQAQLPGAPKEEEDEKPLYDEKDRDFKKPKKEAGGGGGAPSNAVALPVLNLQCNHLLCSNCIQKHIGVWPEFEPFNCPDCKELVSDREKIIQISNFNDTFASVDNDLAKFEDELPTSKRKKRIERPEEFSTKIEALLHDLAEISTTNPHSPNYDTLNFDVDIKATPNKTIVFSQWTSMLDLIEYGLKECQIGYGRLDGTMQRDQRAFALERLKFDPKCEVLLISLRAGGVGLNLTTANRVYMMDSWWNVAVENQAVDRVCRIGQKRPVQVVRYIIQNTIEERILQIQERKTELFKGVLGSGRQRSKEEERKEMLENIAIMFGESPESAHVRKNM